MFVFFDSFVCNNPNPRTKASAEVRKCILKGQSGVGQKERPLCRMEMYEGSYYAL